jgi:hypothetical protein
MNIKIFLFVLLIIVLIILFTNNSVIDSDKTFIKTSADIFVNNLVKSKGMDEFKKYGTTFDRTPIFIECTEKIFNIISSQKDTLNTISKKIGPDDWAIMGYDKFVENAAKSGLDPNSEPTSTLNNEINNMKITANINYDKFYNKNNVTFPSIIGPFNKQPNLKILIALRKIIIEYINKDINNFISNFDSKLLIPKFDAFIDNYISSDINYKYNFSKFSEEKLEPYIISELLKIITTVYNKKIEDIKIFLLTSDIINKILCKDLRGVYTNNACTASEGCLVKTACTYDLKEDCNNISIDPSYNISIDPSYNISIDPSYNIFTTYKTNKCLTSAQSGLRNLVENNASNNDITYDFENEKANITSQYCTKKGLEVTQDSDGNVDCKLTKNKPILESVLGDNLIKTINTKYDKNQYEKCNSNEIDGADYDTIPDNLKTLLNPLIKKYGPIEKSMCIENNYGCSVNKELVNGVCYNKCADGYAKNPDKKGECYKLYGNFENNGELKNADIITRKIINNPYLPQTACPDGYNYNATEHKCIENCPSDYIYNGNSVCKKDYPAKWDGIKHEYDIKKNAIWSQSKVRVFKCLDPNKPNHIDGLCYANCPVGHVRVPGAPYSCRLDPCPESEGYYLTGVNTCYRSPDTKTAWYTKGTAISRWVCQPGYNNEAGVCWANSCPSGYSTSTAGMCIQNCNSGDSTLSPGICNSNCPHGSYRTSAGMCRNNCRDGYNDVGGVCWINDATYSVGVGRKPDKASCDAGQRDDGTSCWEDLKCNTYWDKCSWKGIGGMCVGGVKTSCNGCGCIKQTVTDRYRCNNDEELKGALCYPKCKAGYHKSTVNICQKDGDLSYVPDSFKSTYVPQSIPLPSTPATCPSDRDTIDGLCYPKCRADYLSSSSTTCETNICPQYYLKTKMATCQRDADTKTNPNIGAGSTASLVCPEGTTEASPGGICYPNNPPDGYQRHSISLEQWTEKCPDQWTDTGWFCTRPTKIVKTASANCPDNYNIISPDICKKDCDLGYEYEFKEEKCIQTCPNGTINNTDTKCGREKIIINGEEFELPYKYRIKKRIK